MNMIKKNFMVIDGAVHSTHDVFEIEQSIFDLVFPDGGDVAFLDDVRKRIKSIGIDEVPFFNKLYSNQVDKKSIDGLHGILHSTGSYCLKEYFPSGRESDVRKGQ